MKKLFTKIRAYLYRDVIASNALREAVTELRQTVEKLTESTNKTESTIASHHAVLADLAANVKYLATSEREHLKRAGQRHEL